MDWEGDSKYVGNSLWRSTLLSGTTLLYCYLLRMLLKVNVSSPSRFSFEELLKLALVTGVSNMTLEYFYNQGIIPRKPFK